MRVSGLPEDRATPYRVTLDGEPVWPEPDSPFPPSTLRTHAKRGKARIVFGSCRTAYPHEPPYSLTADEADVGREVDALRAIALRMAETDPHEWPHAVLLLGDQVYADEVSPETLAYIRSHRDTTKPPHEGIANFEEYTQLYRESWTDPPIRWLLSTVPSAMIFDDHDVIDDWNTSLEWVEEMRATDWWDDRVVGGFMSYVLYQHWGNLSPDALEEEEIYQRVRDAGDGGKLLRDYAYKSDREVEGARWSYCRDIGCTRVVMIDSRAGRVLTPGERSMVDAGEWDWITEHATGDFDHLLIGTSLPLFLAPGAALPRGVERGGVRRRVGRTRREAGGEAAPGRRPRALAGVPRLVQPDVRAAAGGRRRARAVSRRARSSCCQATYTTRTWPKSRFRPGAGCDRASGRRRARRSATR